MTDAAGALGPEVLLVPDGAVSGNPGPGGWAVILVSGEHRKELSGGEPHTTNNRMELRGVIEGLKALKRPSRVLIQCDSAYVVNAHRKGWIRTGSATAGAPPPRSRSRTRISGRTCSRPRNRTRSPGSSSRAMRATSSTSARTCSPYRRASGPRAPRSATAQ